MLLKPSLEILRDAGIEQTLFRFNNIERPVLRVHSFTIIVKNDKCVTGKYRSILIKTLRNRETILTFRWIGKSEDGHVVTLHKLKEELFRFGTATGAENIRYGAAIDVETTGLNHDKDTVTEIGLRIPGLTRAPV